MTACNSNLTRISLDLTRTMTIDFNSQPSTIPTNSLLRTVKHSRPLTVTQSHRQSIPNPALWADHCQLSSVQQTNNNLNSPQLNCVIW